MQIRFLVVSAWTTLAGLGLCSCAGGPNVVERGPSDAEDGPPQGVINAEAFHPRLLEIAQGYREFRWVEEIPFVSRVHSGVGGVPAYRMSASDDPKTHGSKVCLLFAEYGMAYTKPTDQPAPVGQVLVKQSHAAVALPNGANECRSVLGRDGRRYVPGKATALFIMYKLDPATPETDEGWVYGTVTPDGKTVTSAGRVMSCMGCHAKAPHDRLFGLPKDAAGAK